jgi:hypothetical protein
MGFPLFQMSAEMCVGRQINVLGSYWKGRMSNQEENSHYKCTVREYNALSFKKKTNSPLVQVYMSKEPDMDAHKDLEGQYITSVTLYKTYIRESSDVVKLPTRQMSPHQK